jgi:hypothetical protein
MAATGWSKKQTKGKKEKVRVKVMSLPPEEEPLSIMPVGRIIGR